MYNVAQGVFYNGVQSVSTPGGSGTTYNLVQAADISKNNNTFVNTDLTVSLAAGQSAFGQIWFMFDMFSNTSFSKWFLSPPAGTTYYQWRGEFWDMLTPQIDFMSSAVVTAFVPTIGTSGQQYTMSIYFSLKTGATAGTLVFQFAQLVNDAVNPLVFRKGAFMNVTVI